MSSIYVESASIADLSPAVLTFNSANNIIERLRYSVRQDKSGRYQFAILDEAGSNLPIPLAARAGSKRA